MNVREFRLEDDTLVKVYKRTSSRNIKLTIDPSGFLKVSIPRWVPYKAALDFVKKKKSWIDDHKPEISKFYPDQSIGKNHHLVFSKTTSTNITTRLSDIEAIIFVPTNLNINDELVQSSAKKVVKKALKKQAENLLPQRLESLAAKYGYTYNSIKIKSLKTRWGSCDSSKNISLNLYLMELPWNLIDYVLLHELNHTKHMHHGQDFWAELGKVLPNLKDLKREIKSHRVN